MEHFSTARVSGKTRRSATGMTLIELAVVIAIMAIFTTFATMAWTGTSENRDATLVQSTQASLQALISQGSAREDVDPSALPSANIVNAMTALLHSGGSATFTSAGGSKYQLKILSTNRTAIYTMQGNGDIQLTGVTGFSQYSVDGTTHAIKRN